MEILFTDLGLKEPVLRAVYDLGFQKPTPIQAKVIPVLLNQKVDVLGLAQTGTGKTAAFGLPIVNNLDFSQKNVQALIIAPTRELCLQICNDLKNYAKYVPSARIVPVYGGASIEVQIKEINRGAQVICATPGRMVDLLNRRKVDISRVSVVVLDEADEMLNMGFKEDLDRILQDTPEDKNTWLFSATMPEEIARITRNYMKNPLEISTGKVNQSAENIEHVYYCVSSLNKFDALCRIIDFNPDLFGIVFCRTKAETREIASQLIQRGYNADALHGDLSQNQRDQVMNKFRLKQIKLLVATDVAARGIDVDNITHVFHYGLPEDIDVYTHRSGRTARAGRHGVSISLVSGKEVEKIPILERKLKKNFVRGFIPRGQEVCEKIVRHFVSQIKNIDASHAIPEEIYNSAVETLSDLDKDELIKKLISIKFAAAIEQYSNSPDLNERSERRFRVKEGLAPSSLFSRFFINVGRIDNLKVVDLVNFVCKGLDCPKKSIGRIDIKNSFSFFELENEFSEYAIRALNGQNFYGRRVRVEKAYSNDQGGKRTLHGKLVKQRGFKDSCVQLSESLNEETLVVDKVGEDCSW